MNERSGLLLAFGAVGIGVVGLGLAASPGTRDALSAGAQAIQKEVEQVVDDAMAWVDTVIGRVSAHEGRYDSLNLNTDGAGLSFGILQWAQKPGTLGKLLKEMQRTDPSHFATAFGPSWPELLQVTLAGSLTQVEGSYLWQEPWISRFRLAGRDPIWQGVQNTVAATGEHFRAAVKAARTIGIVSERSLALFYDTAVQQGPGTAVSLVDQVTKLYQGKSATAVAFLTTYAALAPARFRRTTPPTKPPSSSHLAWKKVGEEWHIWAGQVDLYADILRRRMAIVNDPNLGDVTVALI